MNEDREDDKNETPVDEIKAPRLPAGVEQDPKHVVQAWADMLQNRPLEGEKWASFQMVASNHGAITSWQAIAALHKWLGYGDTTIQEMAERFPDLRGFQGEVYLHSERGQIIPVIYVYGVKDGKKEFELLCLIYENGVFPVRRNGVEIQY